MEALRKQCLIFCAEEKLLAHYLDEIRALEWAAIFNKINRLARAPHHLPLFYREGTRNSAENTLQVRVRVEPEAAIAIQVTTVTIGRRDATDGVLQFHAAWRSGSTLGNPMNVSAHSSQFPDLIIGAYRRSVGISRGSPYKIKSRLISPAMEMSKSVIRP